MPPCPSPSDDHGFGPRTIASYALAIFLPRNGMTVLDYMRSMTIITVWSNYRPAGRMWPSDRIFMARELSQYSFNVGCMLQ